MLGYGGDSRVGDCCFSGSRQEKELPQAHLAGPRGAKIRIRTEPISTLIADVKAGTRNAPGWAEIRHGARLGNARASWVDLGEYDNTKTHAAWLLGSLHPAIWWRAGGGVLRCSPTQPQRTTNGNLGRRCSLLTGKSRLAHPIRQPKRLKHATSSSKSVRLNTNRAFLFTKRREIKRSPSSKVFNLPGCYCLALPRTPRNGGFRLSIFEGMKIN
ncbi:hypothetical protein B0H63DRAFT_178950 [Podospora didyma]|uniref:Uncharacterized protein n=1 Tax=Podospora didyma TaxID=330526 RepID=A0AAE0TZ82_9PEZI|nr:hypothetical protein B0H63DRAFT_178950 [Podospora didyma]